MANAKRASMREGPLAALFRKTEDIEGSLERPGPRRSRARRGWRARDAAARR